MAMTYGDIYVASTSLEVRQLHVGYIPVLGQPSTLARKHTEIAVLIEPQVLKAPITLMLVPLFPPSLAGQLWSGGEGHGRGGALSRHIAPGRILTLRPPGHRRGHVQRTGQC